MAEYQIDRKELKKQDAFVEKGTAVLTVLEKKKSALILSLLAVIALIAGIFYYRGAANEKEQKEASELYTFTGPFNAGFEKLSVDEKKDATVLGKKFKKEIEAIESVISKSSSRAVAYEGAMILGNANYELKLYQAALGFFEVAIKKATAAELSNAAILMKAATLENLKKTDEALAAYAMVADSSGVQKSPLKIQKGQAYLGQARNFEIKGDKIKAAGQLDKYIREFPEATDLKSVESYKARLTR